MKLALGLDVQTNAKEGKFMFIEDSHQGALVCKVDVEVLWEPGNFQDDGAKRVGVCSTPTWSCGRRRWSRSSRSPFRGPRA